MHVCLDTNVFVSVMNREKGHEKCEHILDAIDDGRIDGSVSTIVVAEVLSGLYSNNDLAEADRFVNHVITHYRVCPVTMETASLSARIQSTGLKLPDAIVVATAILENATLVTLDKAIVHKKAKIVSPSDLASML